MIPKALRDKAGLRPEVELDVWYEDGRLIIEPAATPIRLAREGRFLVARAHQAEIEGELTTDAVDATIRRVRER